MLNVEVVVPNHCVRLGVHLRCALSLYRYMYQRPRNRTITTRSICRVLTLAGSRRLFPERKAARKNIWLDLPIASIVQSKYRSCCPLNSTLYPTIPPI